MQPESPGEFDIIARWFQRTVRRRDVVLGIGDDAALLDVPADRHLVAAMDTLVEGVHFPPDLAATHVGHRALAVNLSDLAAMGAEPAWALLSLSLPAADTAWLTGFAEGLHRLADRHAVALVGGDTVRGPLVITVQVLGFVERDAALRRSGARVGDAIYVSGMPGEAAGGLAVVQRRIGGEQAAVLEQRFVAPEPRISLGRAVRRLAAAAMDVSDGLLTDLGKLCAASGVAAELDLDRLPRSAALSALFDADQAEHLQLAGGDDYELLLTVPPGRVTEFERVASQHVSCTCIGRVVEGPAGRVQCLRRGLAVGVEAAGYDHFTTGRGGAHP